jgi:hypothetical protein
MYYRLMAANCTYRSSTTAKLQGSRLGARRLSSSRVPWPTQLLRRPHAHGVPCRSGWVRRLVGPGSLRPRHRRRHCLCHGTARAGRAAREFRGPQGASKSGPRLAVRVRYHTYWMILQGQDEQNTLRRFTLTKDDDG